MGCAIINHNQGIIAKTPSVRVQSPFTLFYGSEAKLSPEIRQFNSYS